MPDLTDARSADDCAVSVVLKTRNNASRLAITLEGLRHLLPPPSGAWELVVVDNGSTDSTPAVLAAAAKDLPLRVVNEPIPGLSRAGNAGIAAARGKLLIFTDDDVRVPADWLRTYVAAHQEHGRSRYYGGPVMSEYEGPTVADALRPYAPASVKGLDWGRDEHVLGKNEWFIGPNWACDAFLVREAGGYDTRIGLGQTSGPHVGEENLLMKKLEAKGAKGLYLPAATIRHWVPASKTSPHHILGRWEESVAVTLWMDDSAPQDKSIFGVPRWVYRELLAAGASLSLASLRGHRELRHEVRFRRARGTARGYRLKVRFRPIT